MPTKNMPPDQPLSRVLIAVCLVAAHSALGDDWPQWRGPHRDNKAPAEGLIDVFPPQGLPRLWKAQAGAGFSSPIVAQDRVVLVDAVLGDGRAQERVRCFHAGAGELAWEAVNDVAYPDWAFQPDQSAGPNATPLAADGRLYMLGATGRLECRELQTGVLVWKVDLAALYELDSFPALSPSPLLASQMLILAVGGAGGAGVVALDPNTGRELWRALEDKPTNSSPLLLRAGGVEQCICWMQQSITSLNPLTGQVYWQERLNTGQDFAVATPVYQDHRLLIGGMMFALDPDRPKAVVLWPKTRAVARRIFSNTSTAMIRNGFVYSARSEGQFLCVSAETGETVWETEQVTTQRNGASIHILELGEKTFLETDEGNLVLADLSERGYREIGRTKIIEPAFPFAGRKVAWPPPAVANQRLYIRNERELICVDLAGKD